MQGTIAYEALPIFVFHCTKREKEELTACYCDKTEEDRRQNQSDRNGLRILERMKRKESHVGRDEYSALPEMNKSDA